MKAYKIYLLVLTVLMTVGLTSKAESIVDVVRNSPDHTILEIALNEANLTDDLEGSGSFTLFAPTDAAFNALPEGTLDALLADSRGALTDVLLYHLVSGKVLSTDLSDGQIVETFNDDDKMINVTVNLDGVFINNAKVTVADIEVDNGVVHVIDAVLVPPTTPETVVDIVINSESHTTLEAAVIAAGLVETLQGDGPFTVFAPTDAAFAALPIGTLNDLLEDPSGALTDILLYHVVAGKAMSSDLSDGQMIETVFGKDVTVKITADGVFINDAMVSVADLEAENGVLHVIDAVLIPSTMPETVVDIVVDSEAHTTLEAAVVAAGLVETLQGEGPFTVFAPTDDAFAALPEGTVESLLEDPSGALTDILLYHVVAGKAMSSDLSDGQMIETVFGKDITVKITADGVYINDAMVSVADLEAENGVVHVIDAVLIPSTMPETVVDIVIDSEVHTTLEAAVVAAGLVETLQGEGPFTVFAPTDDAFAALPEGTVESLLEDPSGALTDILLYHVVAGKAMSSDLSDGQMIETVFGKDITVKITADGVYINDAMVSVADLEAENGVVHVIDAVLIPSTMPETVVDIVVDSEAHTTLEAAVVAAGLVETLQGEGPFTVFAPTDDAFAALPEGTLDDLLADPSGALTDILLYHVVAAKAMSSDLSDGQMITTVFGKDVTVKITTDGVYINDAMVTVADLEAENGVVHVIDAVLVPSLLPATVVDIVVGSPDHTTLTAALTAAGLVETLQGEGPFTVFAPTDDAFAALPEGTLDDLLADPSGALTDILLYHVVAAKAMSSDLSDGQMITTVFGKDVTVKITSDGVYINDAMVTVADLEADNGVVHVIDAVLVPSLLPSTVVDIVVGSPDHTTLTAALTAAGLVETLQGEGPFTVFAPTDDAFAALPEGTLDDLLADPSGALTDILLYHVVAAKAMSSDLSDGQMITTVFEKDVTVKITADGVYINDAMVTVADLEADNGVVHVIDAVLVPSLLPATVVDIVVGSPDHTTLTAALTAAGLVETLQGEGPFTVFAPTDDAFAALPEGTLDDLLADPSGALTDILLYHVVAAKALSSDLSDGQMITTVFGKDVKVTITEDGVYINDAMVTVADLEADNGVVHVIDAVLIPSNLPATVVDIIVESEDHITLEAAVVAAGLVETLQGEGPFTVFAPTDAAFAALPIGTVPGWLEDPEGELTQVLLNHVVAAKAMSSDLTDGQRITTLFGKDVKVTITEDGVYINDAMVTVADLEADNGVVHVIDAVLIPSFLPATVVDIVVGSADHTTLTAALTAAGLVETLQGDGPFTVFAPTDDAFAALPEGTLEDLLEDPSGALTDILLYHVVAGKAMSSDLSDGQMITTVFGKDVTVKITADGVYINDAMVTVADLEADNGVVHVIDAVLIPSFLPATVVDIVVGSPDHTTLTAALTAAGLVETLQGEGPFTVFAPTDDAFAALPEGTLDELLKDPSGALTDILLYHVVAGKAMSSDLSDGQMIETVLGKDVTVTITSEGVFINGAMVTVADLEADNGVVHVIDAVLIPQPEILVKETPEFGTVITDGNGNALYFFTKDADGMSNCTDGCLNNWPVFYSKTMDVGEGLDASDFGSIDRGNGVMQTTFKGWPLYYFVKDSVPGVMLGDGVIGKWFIAKPDYTIMLTDNQLTGLDGVNYKGDYTPGDEEIQYFTDDKGVTLYTWKNDLYNVNKFTKPDFSNNAVWPIYEESQVIIPSVLTSSDFNVINVHGREQLTFKGWPLYYFVQDMEIRGNNKGVSVPSPGVWPVAVNGMMTAPKYPTVVDIVVGSPDHTTLTAALTAAGLVETLQGEGPFTVFAPTDDAFAALPEGTLDDLLADPSGALTDILLYHVVAAKAMSSDLSDGQMITTVFGKDVTVKITADGVYINDAMVTVADLEADNGVVHVIDAVLVPSLLPATVVDIVVGSPDHTTLTAALTAAGLVETLQGEGPFTVFAPTDDAFAALPEGTLDDLLADPSGALTDILLYHVVAAKAMSSDLSDGQMITTVFGKDVTVKITADGVYINDAMVTVADLEADNGVVHVIDAVLVPSLLPATVVDIVVGSPDHTTLTAALTAAGLVETLQGEGPFTVFAPTDDAFAALPEGTLDDLLADPSGALTDILLYHVVAAKAMSSDLSDGQMITTVFGKDVTVKITADGVYINDAMVTVADLEADNGVVHVIDAVLVPSMLPATVVDIVAGSPDHMTLTAALTAAGLVETLQGEGPFTVFAPTDAAFAALPIGTVPGWLEDPEGELTQVLLNHVVSGKAMSSDLSDGQMITTLFGKDVKVTITADGVYINDAMVTVADLEADNGVVHVIDAVLLLPVDEAKFPIDFETETDAVWNVFSNGTGADDDFMVITNPDKSGNNTSDNVLKFKVNEGADPWAGAYSDSYAPVVFTEDSHVVTMMVWKSIISPVGFKVEASTNGGPITEVKVSNTVINQWEKITFDLSDLIGYSYDRIVIFPDFPDTRTSGTTVYIDNIDIESGLPATVVDIVVGSPDHTTLTAALTAAGLVETLQGEGPFTVFAPTDDAFAALPEGTLDELLKDPSGALTDILLYHVVEGKAMSSDLSDGQMITTVFGQDVTVKITADGVYINDAMVTVADLEAKNGVVHVIDAVLIPTVTSIETIEDEINVEVYPNPATDYIRVNTNVASSKVSFRDIAGRIVLEVNDLGSSERIDISGLKSGMYIVSVESDNLVSTQKLIVR